MRRECNIGVPVSKAIPLFGGRATTRRRPPVSSDATSVGLDVYALSGVAGAAVPGSPDEQIIDATAAPCWADPVDRRMVLGCCVANPGRVG